MVFSLSTKRGQMSSTQWQRWSPLSVLPTAIAGTMGLLLGVVIATLCGWL
ncbi:MAG: hypothetical protein ACFCU8_09815 [Thermosynechococcaceae cyanobacterium]